MNRIEVKGYAKINISLDVLGKRPDGYHDVEMVMQQVELHDLIIISKTSGKGIKVSTDRGDLPGDRSNLAYKAAEIFYEALAGRGVEANEGVDITIEKRIPMAAGLAGGSADGAAVLLGMNSLFGQVFSLEEVCELGKKLGSDVPFAVRGQAFLNEDLGFKEDPLAGTCAYAYGTGTDLEMLPSVKFEVVLSKPEVGVSTKEVYEGIDAMVIPSHPATQEILECIKNNNFEQLAPLMGNVLENYTLKRYDTCVYTKDIMSKHAVMGKVLMSGSGPTIFHATQDSDEADRVFDSVSGINRETYRTKTI